MISRGYYNVMIHMEYNGRCGKHRDFIRVSDSYQQKGGLINHFTLILHTLW